MVAIEIAAELLQSQLDVASMELCRVHARFVPGTLCELQVSDIDVNGLELLAPTVEPHGHAAADPVDLPADQAHSDEAVMAANIEAGFRQLAVKQASTGTSRTQMMKEQGFVGLVDHDSDAASSASDDSYEFFSAGSEEEATSAASRSGDGAADDQASPDSVASSA